MDNLLTEIQDIFRETLELDDLIISRETTAADIEEWDSLNHIYLIVAIEKKYKVKFITADIQRWKTVGDMIDDLNKKIG